jgi:transketolase
MRDVFIRRLTQLAEQDSRIMLLTGDLGFSVLDDFARRFPKQFLNVGVAEQNMTGIATGLALDGRVVFTYSIANFSTLRCLEQIRNDAAYHGANVKVVSIGGGFSYGALGMSHHATEDLAILRSMPEVTVVSPCDDWETEQAVDALIQTPGTAYLRLDKSTCGRTERAGETFQLGSPRILTSGKDLAIFSTGGITRAALDVSERLSTKGVSCSVISVHTLSPAKSEEFAEIARNHRAVVVLEEHVVNGGLAGLVAETMMEQGVGDRPFLRFGLRGGFASKVGSQDFLRGEYGLSADAVEATILQQLDLSLKRAGPLNAEAWV